MTARGLLWQEGGIFDHVVGDTLPRLSGTIAERMCDSVEQMVIPMVLSLALQGLRAIFGPGDHEQLISLRVSSSYNQTAPYKFGRRPGLLDRF